MRSVSATEKLDAVCPHRAPSAFSNCARRRSNPTKSAFGGPQFCFGLAHIYLAIGAAVVKRLDQRKVFFAQDNGFANDVPIQVNGTDHEIGLSDFGLQGEQNRLVGGG